ncbi:FHA domain-containing protein [Candidatus Woesearchaeota archaeon]|nr:FHA domain-containing protein [Candidatus Woesearchaeota archaeon]
MQEIARWKIRPSAVGDIYGKNLELERRIIPVYKPILIGTLAGHFQDNKGEWSYELLEIDEETNNTLIKRMLQKKPQLESVVNNAGFQQVLRINPARYRHISRFHAILGTKQGNLYIADLESKNGIYTGLPAEQTRSAILRDGQIIYLGGKAKDSAQIKVHEAISKAYALLVGVDYKNQNSKVIEKEIWQIDQMLRKLGVPYECRTLKHSHATKENITSYLQRAESLPENNLFFFFCGAHGSKAAISSADGKLAKQELAGLLNRIQAKKIMIIDICHAWGGWQELDLDSGLYFFSSQEEETAKWGGFTPGLAERIAELLNKKEPIDMKQIRINDLARAHTPAKKGNKSIILY